VLRRTATKEPRPGDGVQGKTIPIAKEKLADFSIAPQTAARFLNSYFFQVAQFHLFEITFALRPM
jgi:hypothetical protein